MIYLDNCATSYPKPEEVYLAIDQSSRSLSFNSGRGEYQASSKATESIDIARSKIAAIAGCTAHQVVFTASATQALNQIIFGLNLNRGDIVYVSPFEHNSIIRPLKSIEGLCLKVIPFNPQTWELDESALEKLFSKLPPKAVFVSEVSNVTGLRLPWEKIFALSRKYSSLNVLDASQSFRPGNLYESVCDFIVFNGHKSLLGPMGVGGFINRTMTPLLPYLFGGTGSDSLSPEMPKSMPLRYEAGTQNSMAIAALNTAIDWLFDHSEDTKIKLGDDLAFRLKQIPGVIVYQPKGIHTNGIVSFNLSGYLASETASILDSDFNIAVRGGYHCSPLVHEFIQSDEFGGTVRASFGYFNTQKDVDAVVNALSELSEEAGL